MAALDPSVLLIDGCATRIVATAPGTGHGIPLVLLHGGVPGSRVLGAGLHLWGRCAALLAESTRLIAVDLPGCGGSVAPREAIGIPVIAAHLRTLLDALGLARVHLVGHDLGGLLALHLGIDVPERVAAITVVSSPTAAPSGDGVENLTLAHPPAPAATKAAQRWVLERLCYSHHVVDDALVDDCLAAVGRPAHREAVARLAQDDQNATFTASLMQAKSRLFEVARTTGLAMPVQVIWGSDDPLAPVDHGIALFRLVAAKQVAAQFHVVNRAGHLLFRDEPEHFARLVGAFRAGLGIA